MTDINKNLMVLPDNLPRPEDDGGANHLVGSRIPHLSSRSTSGELVNLSELPHRTIVYAYPMTGGPNVQLPKGWNDIPGARMQAADSCLSGPEGRDLRSWRGCVWPQQPNAGISEGADGSAGDFVLDPERCGLQADRERAPSDDVRRGVVLLKRLTLVINDGVIEHVFYPVFPPKKAAADVVACLTENPLAARRQQGMRSVS
jgi:hypothetical protein